MSEADVRQVLTRIDKLRAKAQAAIKMHTYWHSEEMLAVERPVVVKRRWRPDRIAHMEYVMSDDELNLFREWLMDRARALNAEANSLAASLKGVGHA